MSNMLPSTRKTFANFNGDRTKRSSNFSTKEVKFLLQLVDDRKEIIESKKGDRTTSEEKVKAWMEIEEKFNAVFDDYRNFKVLKTKYDNLKKNFKRKMPPNISNLNVLKVMKSTDNPVGNEPLSDIDYDMSEDENTFQNSNASDTDTKPIPSFNEEELDAAAEEYVFETLLLGDTQSSTPIVEQNTNTIPEPLQQQPTKPAAQKKRSSTVDVWEEVAHKKLRKLELEIKVMGEEWEFKKQKLELEVEGVRIENKFKEERLKLELELLKQKLQNSNMNISN